jgi:hypothetical protein
MSVVSNAGPLMALGKLNRSKLTSQVGCEAEITLEISARRPQGFDESTVRTLTENSRTLKFEHYGFEEG